MPTFFLFLYVKDTCHLLIAITVNLLDLIGQNHVGTQEDTPSGWKKGYARSDWFADHPDEETTDWRRAEKWKDKIKDSAKPRITEVLL